MSAKTKKPINCSKKASGGHVTTSQEALRQIKARFDLARTKADIKRVTHPENIRLLSAFPEHCEFFMKSVVGLCTDNEDDIRCRYHYFVHIRDEYNKNETHKELYARHLISLGHIDPIMVQIVKSLPKLT